MCVRCVYSRSCSVNTNGAKVTFAAAAAQVWQGTVGGAEKGVETRCTTPTIR